MAPPKHTWRGVTAASNAPTSAVSRTLWLWHRHLERPLRQARRRVRAGQREWAFMPDSIGRADRWTRSRQNAETTAFAGHVAAAKPLEAACARLPFWSARLGQRLLCRYPVRSAVSHESHPWSRRRRTYPTIGALDAVSVIRHHNWVMER